MHVESVSWFRWFELGVGCRRGWEGRQDGTQRSLGSRLKYRVEHIVSTHFTGEPSRSDFLLQSVGNHLRI